jgi:hypothetical protein
VNGYNLGDMGIKRLVDFGQGLVLLFSLSSDALKWVDWELCAGCAWAFVPIAQSFLDLVVAVH